MYTRYHSPAGDLHMDLYNAFCGSAHTLIAGTTGSGKSVLIQSMIHQMIIFSPADSRLVLIDPKGTELTQYRKLPHTVRYGQSAEECAAVLRWTEAEMRKMFSEKQRGRLTAANGYPANTYVIIDELADLVISDYGKEIKSLIQKIGQLGRAVGIHLIAATQAPNRAVLPAQVVLNFDCRIALRCLSPIESRQIINVAGAESLPRYGEAIALYPGEGYRHIPVPMFPKEEREARIAWWMDKRHIEKKWGRCPG